MTCTTQLSAALVGASLAISGCAHLFDTPPPADDCTSHYGASAADGLLGTIALVTGLSGVYGGFIVLDRTSSDGFGVASLVGGLVGVTGAVLHYASAAGNDVAECQRLREKRRR